MSNSNNKLPQKVTFSVSISKYNICQCGSPPLCICTITVENLSVQSSTNFCDFFCLLSYFTIFCADTTRYYTLRQKFLHNGALIFNNNQIYCVVTVVSQEKCTILQNNLAYVAGPTFILFDFEFKKLGYFLSHLVNGSFMIVFRLY